MKKILSLMVLGILTGCGSPAPFNYTLSPASSTASMIPGAAKVGPYALGDVTVPAEADQSSLVVQQSDGRVLILAEDRWSAPLSSHIQSALSVELTSRLGMPPLQNLSSGRQDPKVSFIRVDIQRFDLVPGQYVTIHALWRIRFAESEKLLTCFAKFQQPVPIGVSALVAGQQKNTQLLSDLIAQSLVSRTAPGQATCSER